MLCRSVALAREGGWLLGFLFCAGVTVLVEVLPGIFPVSGRAPRLFGWGQVYVMHGKNFLLFSKFPTKWGLSAFGRCKHRRKYIKGVLTIF